MINSRIIKTLTKVQMDLEEHYKLARILTTNADYYTLIGKRSNGKTFAVKQYCLEDFAERGNRFVYLRREKVDLGPHDIEHYFQDDNMSIEEVTGGKYTSITAWGGMIYAVHETDGKVDRKDICGRAVSLASAKHFKSQYFPRYENIIFEEWLTDDGYLPNEPNRLQHFVSTVARLKKIKVFLIGNTIDADCIYFREWQLVNVPTQKLGTIDIYEVETEEKDENGEQIIVTIAVEMCDDTTTKGKMFFGDVSKSINSGHWESRAHPHLPDTFENYNVHYQITFVNNLLSYKLVLVTHKTDSASGPLLYCYPTRKINTKRIITKDFSANKFVSQFLYPVCTGDKIIIDLIKKKRIVYSDNLTGTQISKLLPQLIRG